MEETKTEEQTSEKTEEQSTQTEETTEETKVEPSELEQKNKDLFARAKKAEEGEKKLKEELAKLQPKETSQQPADTADPWKERMEFVVENRNLKKEEVQEIIRYAEGAKITYEEALKTPFVSNALKAMQAEEKSEQVTPSPSAPVRSGINIAMSGGEVESSPQFVDGKPANPVKRKTFSEIRAERAKK